MVFKNSLAASGYIVSLVGGGYTVHHFFQENNIGDVLKKLGQLHTRKEDFQKAFNTLKDDSQFKADIGTGNEEGWQLLKNWCDSKLALPLNEENIKVVLPKAQKYCLDFPQIVNSESGKENTGLTFQNVKKRIANKGVSPKGQLFVSFVDTTSREKGRQQPYFYCWDTEKNDWKDTKGTEDCRKKNVLS